MQREPDYPAIAVYFVGNGVEQCIACDRYPRTGKNMRVIGKTIDALRGIERWETSQMVDAAFRGFAVLPETTSATAWWDVLGVLPGARWVEIEWAFWALAKTHHPDRGGDPEVFHQVQAAYRQAKEAVPG